MEKVIDFNNAKNAWKKSKITMFFVYLQILFEKWNMSQVWCFSNFLQKQHVKTGCTMQNLARHVCKNVWSMVEMVKNAVFWLVFEGQKIENFIFSIDNVFTNLLNTPYYIPPLNHIFPNFRGGLEIFSQFFYVKIFWLSLVIITWSIIPVQKS